VVGQRHSHPDMQMYLLNTKPFKESWNETAVKIAWDATISEASVKSPNVYAASKVESEKAAWKWVAENQPRFTFNTVLPNMNVGFCLC
jgi:hypothetical protein